VLVILAVTERQAPAPVAGRCHLTP
jgi:hypothetical protein